MSRWQEYKKLVTGDPEFVAFWNKQIDESENKEKTWITWLRNGNIKAAHPDDGWVDREMNTIQLVYPAFNDGIKVGDRIALGDPEEFRVVKVRGIEKEEQEKRRYHRPQTESLAIEKE